MNRSDADAAEIRDLVSETFALHQTLRIAREALVNITTYSSGFAVEQLTGMREIARAALKLMDHPDAG